MHSFDDDDRPTVAGGRHSGSRRDEETRGANRDSGSAFGQRAPHYEERPTTVHRKGPEIGSVAWFYCRKGLRKGQLYQFRKPRNEFGRAPDCDVAFEDEFCSAHQGAILLEEGVWKIFDFASTNGTFVNGKRLGVDAANPVELNDGDIVTVGETEFVFKKV